MISLIVNSFFAFTVFLEKIIHCITPKVKSSPYSFISLDEVKTFYNNDLRLPVYSENKDHASETYATATILISDNVPDDKIATATPLYVRHNVEFIIDTKHLGDWRDAKDDNIVGMTRSSTKSFYSMNLDDELQSASKDEFDYKITRYTYYLKEDTDFHKVIITVSDHNNIMHPLVYIQYYFDNGEHNITFKETDPNAREKSSFSARKCISEHVNQNLSGKKAFHSIYKASGGFENARTLSNLPQDYKQIYNAKSSKEYKDELVEILDLCQGQSGSETEFIRDVRTAPEKSIFLSTNNQLNDIERFCTIENSPSILGVDPTFNICDYNVTITTYKHLLLHKNGTQENPVMIGPILIH